MRRLVARLKPPPSRSLASRYEANFPHSEQYRKQKEAAVAQFMRTRRPGRVFDLGCNQGTYSFLALREGARSTISVDADPAAIDALYREAKRQVQTFYRWCRT